MQRPDAVISTVRFLEATCVRVRGAVVCADRVPVVFARELAALLVFGLAIVLGIGAGARGQ